MTEASTLAIRALNYWRPRYLPTYIGIRAIAAAKIVSRDSAWVQHAIIRKSVTGSLGVYHNFRLFKSVDEKRRYQYRDCSASNPLTALAEAWWLDQLSSLSGFKNHPCVYSYRWPVKEEATGSYQHYSHGFNLRNRRIREFLQNDPTLITYVFDIKDFYPSVSRKFVRQKFFENMSLAQVSHDKQQAIRQIAEHYLSIKPDGKDAGIAIGPSPSHLFGNLMLTDLDQAMQARYGQRYFRYVDDLIVIASRHEEDTIRRTLETHLEPHKLRLHSDKEDALAAHEWLTHECRFDQPTWDGSFEGIKTRVMLFFALKKDLQIDLGKRLKDIGISLPFRQLHAQSKSWRIILYWLRHRPAWVGKAVFETPRSLVASLLSLRTQMWHELELHLMRGNHDHESPTVRKWAFQKIRYFANRLIYLIPRTDYARLASILPDDPALYETKAVLETLADNDLTRLLMLPGSAASAVGSLSLEHETVAPLEYASVRNFSAPAYDTLVSLAVYGLFNLPNQRPNPDLLSLMCGQISSKRILADHSFEDELDSLLLNHEKGSIQKLISSRYDDREDINLDALRLGGGGSSYY